MTFWELGMKAWCEVHNLSSLGVFYGIPVSFSIDRRRLDGQTPER